MFLESLQLFLLITACLYVRGRSASISPSIVHISRVYSEASLTCRDDFNIDNDHSYSDISTSVNCNWIPQDDIELVRYIDAGRFSNVFEGVYRESESYLPIRCIVKVLKPTIATKAWREIKILCNLRQTPDVIYLHGISKNEDSQIICLILESIGVDARWLSHRDHTLTPAEIKLCTYKLLKTLDQIHSKGIMHRDIKPRNVIYSRRSSELRIIDFGLSDVYVPGKQYNPSVASRHYKCPELLFEYPYYDYGIDIWSAGCVFAGLIFNKDPFFKGADKNEQIRSIASTVGTNAILSWAKKWNINISDESRLALGSYRKKKYTELRTAENAGLLTSEAIDLVEKMLEVDHLKRFTAKECLQHPYFKDIHDTDGQ